MTRNEAIKILEGAIKKPNTQDGYLGQALTMGIDALKVEPCKDTISRQAAIDDIGKDVMGGLNYESILKRLPPVQPIRPTGHWKYVKNSEVNGLKIVECSVCNKRTYGSSKFCPNCGADMRESEDEE